MKHDTLIVIKHGRNAVARKITSIQPYMKDGGFAVRMPYHQEHKGYLAKVPAMYDRHVWRSKIEEWEKYTVDHRVKLSYHVNGFLQFSSDFSFR